MGLSNKFVKNRVKNSIRVKRQKDWRLLDRQFSHIVSHTDQTPLGFHFLHPAQ